VEAMIQQVSSKVLEVLEDWEEVVVVLVEVASVAVVEVIMEIIMVAVAVTATGIQYLRLGHHPQALQGLDLLQRAPLTESLLVKYS